MLTQVGGRSQEAREYDAFPAMLSANPLPPGHDRWRTMLSYVNPLLPLRDCWRHRALIGQLVHREIEGRYRGSLLGVVWALLHPLILLLVYTFVFGVVFRMRWPQAAGDDLSGFALVLMCGLLAYNLCSECLTRAPFAVTAVPNYVKKVIFPLQVLPITVLGSGLFHAAVGLVLLMVAGAVIRHSVPWTVVLVPVVAAPLVLLLLGATWFLSSLGVFVRDVGYIVNLACQVLLFMTPVFYPLAALPEAYRPLVTANPLTGAVEDLRRTVLWGEVPDWSQLATRTAVATVVMAMGYAWFMTTRRGFADVL